jgi:hypothetical protein
MRSVGTSRWALQLLAVVTTALMQNSQIKFMKQIKMQHSQIKEKQIKMQHSQSATLTN